MHSGRRCERKTEDNNVTIASAAENRFLPNTTLPNGSFAAIGARPQVILVIPSRGIVVAHQTGTDSVCPFGRTDCSFRLLSDSKVFTLPQMIVAAKKRIE
jgi:hypothetical protein